MSDNIKMIEPVSGGQALLSEIKNTTVESGFAIWWLGQSGFAIKSGQTTAYIDLYLSEQLTAKYKDAPNPHIRMTRAPFRGEEITGADLVLSTHRHSDHMDAETVKPLMASSPGAKYIIPAAHKEHVCSWGLDEGRLILAKVDRPIIFRDLAIIPQPAKHEQFDYSQQTGYPHMSYIIKSGGVTLYHSGDTIPYRGMVELLAKYDVDVLMLPINGRDKQRHSFGTAGNFTIQEALCLAELSGAKMLIPHHYDMFSFNTADISEFVEQAGELHPDVNYCVLKCGERKLLPGF